MGGVKDTVAIDVQLWEEYIFQMRGELEVRQKKAITSVGMLLQQQQQNTYKVRKIQNGIPVPLLTTEIDVRHHVPKGEL